MVFAEHTYDNRADQLLREVDKRSGRFAAPARRWREERVRLVYLDYHAAHARLDYACSELCRILRSDPRGAATGGTLVARAFARKVRSKLSSALQWSK